MNESRGLILSPRSTLPGLLGLPPSSGFLLSQVNCFSDLLISDIPGSFGLVSFLQPLLGTSSDNSTCIRKGSAWAWHLSSALRPSVPSRQCNKVAYSPGIFGLLLFLRESNQEMDVEWLFTFEDKSYVNVTVTSGCFGFNRDAFELSEMGAMPSQAPSPRPFD